VRRGAPFDTCFALSASTCIVTSLGLCIDTIGLVCLRIYDEIEGEYRTKSQQKQERRNAGSRRALPRGSRSWFCARLRDRVARRAPALPLCVESRLPHEPRHA